MERIFQQTSKRKTLSLDGQWTITYDSDNQGASRGYPKGQALNDHPAYVPSCWNFDLGHYDYMGLAWYCRTFQTTDETHARLIFHAVSGQADVFLDGQYLGQHYGSYTRFTFDLPRLTPGQHQLIVKVDNTVNDQDTLPLRYVDWYVYGGIYRSVELQTFDSLSIDRIKIETQWQTDYTVKKILLHADIKNWIPKDLTDEFILNLDGRKLTTQTQTIPAQNSAQLTFTLTDLPITLWSPEQPQLYSFTLACASDDLTERTGFRKIETDQTRILLNGREIFIKGINRHNDHPDLGYAVNPPLILRDLQIIKNLGCNSVRGSHYPNDPVVLDYCDQMGLLFWEELPFWNHPADSLASPLLEKRARMMIRETIERDFNHPAIIFWSIQNESKSSSPEGLGLFTKIAKDIRALDNSRLVTFASACGRNDLCFDLVDVVCWNMYPGWYDDDQPLDTLAQRLTESLKNHRQWLHQQQQNKPYLISEFGAGAILGVTTFDQGRRWTENYQQKLFQQTLDALINSHAVQGFYIWQYCDGRTALQSKISIGRPRTFNNKGLVDEYRRPKRAYDTVREILQKTPTYL